MINKICIASLQNLAMQQDFYSVLGVPVERFCQPRIRWCGTGGFQEQASRYWPKLLYPYYSLLLFFPLFFLSICCYCGAGVFGPIGCISLSLSLALPTFSNNNNNNNNIVIIYKKWKKYYEIQLTKNKMDLNTRKMTNYPPSPCRQTHKFVVIIKEDLIIPTLLILSLSTHADSQLVLVNTLALRRTKIIS